MTSPASKKTSAIADFFFAKEAPYGMALLRITLPIVAAIPMFMRFPRVRELYSSDGAPVQMFEMFGVGDRLPTLAPEVAVPLFGLMLLCFVTGAIGFRTRLSLAIATVVYVFFCMSDGIATMTKYNVIASHMLLLLTVSNCGAVWSVDAILQRNATGEVGPPPLFPVWPARLVQILFAHMYFGAAITKVQTETFFSGEQMRYWMLSNWNYDNPVGEALAMWAPILTVSAYMAVVWEMMFPFLVWQRRTRWVVLLLGAMFHFSTWLILGLYIFPAVCITGYFAFISEKDVALFRTLMSRFRIPNPFRQLQASAVGLVKSAPAAMPATATWICLAAITAIGATEAELQMDLYGSKLPGGGYELKPMDPLVAKTMISDQRAIREQDKYFSFEIGTRTIGEQLANRRDSFEFGETMIAQANLNPPHEDMWVDCLLQDEQGHTIEHFGQPVTRDQLRSNFTYKFGNRLVPGRYSMVLKSGNKEVYRRPFELLGNPENILTN